MVRAALLPRLAVVQRQAASLRLPPWLRPALFTLGACGAAALGWWLAGGLADFLGLAALDLPARAGGVLLALALLEAALARAAQRRR